MLRVMLILFLSLLTTTKASGLGEETFGNKPFSDVNFRDWPNVMPLQLKRHSVQLSLKM